MKRIPLLTIVISSLALFAAGKLSPATSLAAAEAARSRSFDFVYVAHVPALPAGARTLRLWIPLPYEDAYQSVASLRIESPVAYRIRREAEYGNRYAYLVIAGVRGRKPFDVRISFRATRFEHHVDVASVNDAPVPALATTARFLQADRLVPTDGAIAELSGEQTQGATLPLDKARKIYDYVISTMRYDHDGSDWGRGDALWTCQSKHGNCTDFHSLFIAMARAAGIPARFEIGFPLPAASTEGQIASYHCWAEFYVEGAGWIPVDASEAWKHKELKDYYFGSTDANRVMFTLGRDVRLNPPQQGDPLNYSVYPYAELDGKPFAGVRGEYSFRDARQFPIPLLPLPAENFPSAMGASAVSPAPGRGWDRYRVGITDVWRAVNHREACRPAWYPTPRTSSRFFGLAHDD